MTRPPLTAQAGIFRILLVERTTVTIASNFACVHTQTKGVTRAGYSARNDGTGCADFAASQFHWFLAATQAVANSIPAPMAIILPVPTPDKWRKCHASVAFAHLLRRIRAVARHAIDPRQEIAACWCDIRFGVRATDGSHTECGVQHSLGTTASRTTPVSRIHGPPACPRQTHRARQRRCCPSFPFRRAPPASCNECRRSRDGR